MKQIIQNYRTGDLELADVPIPVCSSNQVLVKNVSSLISLGTERSIIDLGKKSLLGKAKARPDLVRRFIDKAKKEGFLKTFNEALGRLDNPTPLGYSSAGIVIEVGKNIHGFSPGDRVACIGAGYASHADYVTMPENLCCRLPDNVSFEEASFGMLGIISLHGIRCAKLTFGETVAVVGLGLLGLLTVQILKAYGCNVVGMDIDMRKAEMAMQLGADQVYTSDDDLKNGIDRTSKGFGADVVIITASSKSDGPINTAVEISRFGGRVVIVGVADIHPQRNELWQKEVEFIVSKAGGPGIFDPFYENMGIDYPIGLVRWTENRNLEEFLRLVLSKRVNVSELISHRFKIENAEAVYEDMLSNKRQQYIGVVLEYPAPPDDSAEVLTSFTRSFSRVRTFDSSVRNGSEDTVSLGVIGAGLFGKAVFLPVLSQMKGARFHTLSTSSSPNAYHTGKKYGFENCSTDYLDVVNNSGIDSAIILAPHRLHSKMVIECLKAGKHVFVEKPLCVDEMELREIITVCTELEKNNALPNLMVGYNRRFSPHAFKIKEMLRQRQDPLVVHCRINPGFVGPDHWVHSEAEGGSRVIGEICHFVDLMIFLTGCCPVQVYADRVSGNNRTVVNSDNLSIVIKFADGSIGNIVYSASGTKSFSREYYEIFSDGRVITLNDFTATVMHREGNKQTFKTKTQEIGYREELQNFIDSARGIVAPQMSLEEIFSSTLTVFKINESLGSGKAERVCCSQ